MADRHEKVIISYFFTGGEDDAYGTTFFFSRISTGESPVCITNNCKTSNCIKEPTLDRKFIKVSVPCQVFQCGAQNHITSYKTTCDIRAKGSVYRKHSKIIIIPL